MNKLTKTLLSFGACATLLFSTVNSVAFAQESVVEVVDVRTPKTSDKYVVKVTLSSQEEETADKVVYYLTGNNTDVSFSQIQQLLTSLGVQFEGALEYGTFDSTTQTLSTNVGEMTVQVFDLKAKVSNLSAVELPASTESSIHVTELEEKTPFQTLLVTVKFQETGTTNNVAEYHFVAENEDEDKVILNARSQFEQTYGGEYMYSEDGNKTSQVGEESQLFSTNVGEVTATPVEFVISIEKKVVESVVEETTSSQGTTSEATSTSSVESTSVTEASSSTSTSEASTSVAPESQSTSETDVSSAKDEKKLVAVKSSSMESKSDKAESNKNGKSNLPQTGEVGVLSIAVSIVLIGVVGLFLTIRKTEK